MRVVRVGLPAIVGVLVLLFGLQSVSSGLDSGSAGLQGVEPSSMLSGFQVGALPIGIGIALLLAAFATARRTRLGYFLGVAVGALMALAGLAAIAIEIPYLQQGGTSAAFGGGIVIAAGVWTLLWLVYTWRFTKSRAEFAPAWTPSDRRLGIAVVAVVSMAAATFLALGALQSTASVGV